MKTTLKIITTRDNPNTHQDKILKTIGELEKESIYITKMTHHSIPIRVRQQSPHQMELTQTKYITYLEGENRSR